jgi:hypothetical protein
VSEIISRKEAIRLGLDYYFTGKPCKRSHLSERRRRDRACVACGLEKLHGVAERRCKRVDMTGQRHGRLVALSCRTVQRDSYQQVQWLCRCDCGTEKWIPGSSLRQGHTQSCGCLQQERGAENRDKWRETRPGSVKFPGIKSRTPEYRAAVYQADKPAHYARTRKYQLEHADELSAYLKTYRAARADELRKKRRQWELENGGLLRANNIRRRLRQEERTPMWVDYEALNKFYKECPPGMEVDHRVPLLGRTFDGYRVSGLHVPWNLQYLSREENRRKKHRMRREDHDPTETIG